MAYLLKKQKYRIPETGAAKQPPGTGGGIWRHLSRRGSLCQERLLYFITGKI